MFNIFAKHIPLSLYIHFPWCETKCPYCDFNSYGLNKTQFINILDKEVEKNYIQALIQQAETHIPEIWGRKLNSIFIGGGTPSLISSDAINYLFSSLRSLFGFNNNIEITMEVNPSSVEKVKFNEIKHNLNRISVGVQSFDNIVLKKIGRVHNGKQALQAIIDLQDIGFKNINLDLIYGVTNNSKVHLTDLQQAINLEPAHLSFYQLTLEPNTIFFKNPPKGLATEEMNYSTECQAMQVLKEAGYYKYEVSAFTNATTNLNKQCKHNLNYWQFGDYLGLGAGASSKITKIDVEQIYRLTMPSSPKKYVSLFKKNQTHTELLQSIESYKIYPDEKNLIFEFMLNSIRLEDGFSLENFEKTTNINRIKILKILDKLENKELITRNFNHILLTPQGRNFRNNILEYFLPK